MAKVLQSPGRQVKFVTEYEGGKVCNFQEKAKAEVLSKDKKAEKPAAVVGKSKGKVEKKIPLPEMDPDHGDDDQDDKDEEEEGEM